ncbi:hypothetical protein ACQ4M3_42070 [Leptolyngbya sp. AN03gr2]|uniref:hypothetical protein n=1 Tax=unclassified Leptolyngbya TaxID=2650499 RepID=UPI003D319B68
MSLHSNHANHPKTPNFNLALILEIAVLGAVLATSLLYYIQHPEPAEQQSSQDEIHPTAIPWLQSEEACRKTGRTWKDETCWDHEHSPDF